MPIAGPGYDCNKLTSHRPTATCCSGTTDSVDSILNAKYVARLLGGMSDYNTWN